jgi:glycosyltransferase involved in cell wall biosynthesis
MDKELPKVSIVLPTHNGAKYIRQSIDSCLSQTYKNIELIIVDDCSIDETPNIVMSYSDERIKYVRHDSNKRLPAALNTGFEIATGEYLTWTSDDNFFYAHAIEKMLSCFLTQRNIDVVYANYQAEFENGDTKYIDVGLPSDLFIYDSIGPCFIFRRQIYDKLGGYNTGWALVEDYEYWLKI